MLRIDITPFKSGLHHVELHPDPEDLDLDPERFGDLCVEATLDCHRDRILVRLFAEGTAALVCDRTLRPYRETLEGSYVVLFGPPRLATPDAGDEVEYEEIRPLERSDHEIDITEFVRDTLLLAIPQRKIAPGAEDEDITMQFGSVDAEDEEASIDPRWEALRALRSSEEEDA